MHKGFAAIVLGAAQRLSSSTLLVFQLSVVLLAAKYLDQVCSVNKKVKTLNWHKQVKQEAYCS